MQYVFRAGCNSPPAVCHAMWRARERPASFTDIGVSRSGEMPEPTVIVRMREDVPAQHPVIQAPTRLERRIAFGCRLALKRFSPTSFCESVSMSTLNTPQSLPSLASQPFAARLQRALHHLRLG